MYTLYHWPSSRVDLLEPRSKRPLVPTPYIGPACHLPTSSCHQGPARLTRLHSAVPFISELKVILHETPRAAAILAYRSIRTCPFCSCTFAIRNSYVITTPV